MSPNNTFIPDGFNSDKSCARNDDDATDFDTAVTLTGYGRYHFKITAVCALCLLTNGIQNGLPSYVFPAAQCDLNLTSAQIGFLNVSFLIGGICSAFLWGAIADLLGRRKILYVTLIMNSIVTFVSAFSQNFISLAIFRYFNGLLIGAPGSITFNYIAEFHAPKQRTKSVCYSGIYFTAAFLLLPTLSYLIIPLPKLNFDNGIYLSSWRLFLLVISIPELLTGIWLYFMPESPKLLAEKGKVDEALKILKEMHKSNLGDSVEYAVKRLKIKNDSDKVTSGEEIVCSGKITRMLGEMLVQMKKLFKPPILFFTVLVSMIMFCNMFGYFGLGLWLPELFTRFEQYHEQFPNRTVTVKHLASLTIITNQTCVPEFDGKLFRNTFSIGASSLIGNAISGWLSGKVSLKLVPLLTMLMGAISSGSIYWLTSSLQNLLVACIFQGAMATANVAIGSVAVEIFPTSVAAMALCLTLFVGRLGAMVSNILFGLLMDTKCEIPIFLVSAILFSGTLMCLLIPNNQEKIKFLSKKSLPVDIIIDQKY